jgi:hypothetical protein
MWSIYYTPLSLILPVLTLWKKQCILEGRPVCRKDTKFNIHRASSLCVFLTLRSYCGRYYSHVVQITYCIKRKLKHFDWWRWERESCGERSVHKRALFRTLHGVWNTWNNVISPPKQNESFVQRVICTALQSSTGPRNFSNFLWNCAS